mmetsp:Transcript_33310/g.86395  ORF Transcript_33310/g.86395 Transcript_33310/m.86395 type:complete len:305 (+) Transcript_33310:619-1533(+)
MASRRGAWDPTLEVEMICSTWSLVPVTTTRSATTVLWLLSKWTSTFFFPAELQLGAVVVQPHRGVGVLQHVADDSLVPVGDVRLLLVPTGIQLHILDVSGHLSPRRVHIKSAVCLKLVHLLLVEAEVLEQAQLVHVLKDLVLERVEIRLGHLWVPLLDFANQLLLELRNSLLLIEPHRINGHVRHFTLRHLASVVESIVVCVPLLPHVSGYVLEGIPSHQLPHPGVPLLEVPAAAELLEFRRVHRSKSIHALGVIPLALDVAAGCLGVTSGLGRSDGVSGKLGIWSRASPDPVVGVEDENLEER